MYKYFPVNCRFYSIHICKFLGNLLLFLFLQSVLFTHDPTTLSVRWEDFSDPESDIKKFEILLTEGSGCTPPDITDKEAEFDVLSKNLTDKTYLLLELQVGT